MNQIFLTKNASCKCKCRFDGKNVNQINGGITTKDNVSVKNVTDVKKIIFAILLHLVAEV